MATKERNQNPVIGDTVNLDLFVYNSNNFASVDSINQINIYYLDQSAITLLNPSGKVLVQVIGPGDITNPAVGQYQTQLYLDPAIYLDLGTYIDEWEVVFSPSEPVSLIENGFVIYEDLWYTTPLPVVYDFSFYFQPNKFRMGEKKQILIEIDTNVPHASDLERYYVDLAIGAQLYVYIGSHCDPCSTCDELLVDGELTTIMDKNRAFYTINTELFDCGIYDIWFKMLFGANTYISPKSQFLIYD